MILEIIIAGIIIYYLILFWWLRKKRRKMPLQKEEINHEKRSIIGESTFRLRQVTSYKATKRQFSKGVNNTSTFALQDTEDTPLPMDIEFEMVFEEHVRKEELEGEELEFGGLFGSGPVMKVNRKSPAKMIQRGGRIPAPLQSLKN